MIALRPRAARAARAGRRPTSATDELTRERVLACAVRLLDRGFFRIGTEEYTVRTSPTAWPRCASDHVTLEDERARWSSTTRPRAASAAIQAVVDPHALESSRALKRRRGGGPELLAYKDGRRGATCAPPDINAYLKEATGDDFSAKDFRTWNATVLAAVALAVSGAVAGTKTARKRAITRAVKEVAHYLGNTPAVCRASYIDPRVFDAYRGGLVIARRAGGGADASPASCRSTTRRSSRRCST